MKKNRFMLALAVVFSAIFWTLSGVFVHGWIAQAGTSGWPSTTGEVIASRVATRTGSKGGHTYAPEVDYKYTVGANDYNSSSISLSTTFSDSGGGYARRTVAQFPAGRKIAVYYDPSDASRSVLLRGTGDRDWQMLGLVALFLSVPVVLWVVYVRSVCAGGRGHVGTVRVLEPAPGFTVVRAVTVWPWVAGAAAWFTGLVATFVAVLLAPGSSAREVLLIGWGATVLATFAAWLWRTRWITAGRCDTVIDRASGVLIPPRGRRPVAESIALARVTGIRLKQDSPISTNNARHWRIHLVVEGEPKSRPIADVRTKADARTFDAWLRARAGLPPAEGQS